eukprot:1158994-Pelagomonas_calceolata.AAC.4
MGLQDTEEHERRLHSMYHSVVKCWKTWTLPQAFNMGLQNAYKHNSWQDHRGRAKCASMHNLVCKPELSFKHAGSEAPKGCRHICMHFKACMKMASLWQGGPAESGLASHFTQTGFNLIVKHMHASFQPPSVTQKYKYTCRRELEGAAKSLFAYTGCLMRKAFMAWVQTAINQINMRNKVAGALLGYKLDGKA